MKVLTTLFFALVLFRHYDTTVVYRPIFAKTRIFYEGDSILFADFYKNKKRVYSDTINFIENVDSCNVYVAYGIHEGFYHDYFLDNQKRLIETYLRISSDSWLHISGSTKDTVYENRTTIISTDSIYKEDIVSYELELFVKRYYSLTKR